jgi:hypothetical protein
MAAGEFNLFAPTHPPHHLSRNPGAFRAISALSRRNLAPRSVHMELQSPMKTSGSHRFDAANPVAP